MTEDLTQLSDRDLERELIRQDDLCDRLELMYFRPEGPRCTSLVVQDAQARYSALDAEIERRSK
jgi:hypothetical protein